MGPPTPKQPTREKRRSRCAEDWRPTVEQVARAKERSPSIDIDHEVEQFRNFHIGRGTLAADWGRTWATWVGNHAERAQRLARGRGRVYTGEQWADGRADAGWDNFERGDQG